MFRRLDDFLETYEHLSASTGKTLAALTDASLSQSVGAGHRTLGHIAWHIVVTVPEMMNRTGLGLSAVDHGSPPPTTAREIVAAHQRVSAELSERLKASWSDATLLETDDMYGTPWPRGMTLAALVNHEVHHRGQMTVLMRQAGLRVPGVFGPSREEWAQFGAQAPPY